MAQDTLNLSIDSMAVGGKGVARLPEGKVVFVAGALPGEKVAARITEERKDFCQAETLEVLSPSPGRVRPACPNYGLCGGCDLMHLDPGQQAAAKAAAVAGMLGRLPGLPAPRVVASPAYLGCRNRLRFQVGEEGLGFFQPASHSLARLEDCPLAPEPIRRALAGLGRALAGKAGRGMRWLSAVAGEGRGLLLFAHLRPGYKPGPAQRRQWQEAARSVGAVGLRVEGDRWPLEPEKGLVCYQGQGLELFTFPGLFCQVNFAANRLLVDLVRQAADHAGSGPLLDLFAGSGNFTLPLAVSGREALGVESQGEAVEAAAFNKVRNRLPSSVAVVKQQAREAVRGLANKKRGFQTVLLDPPRAGAKGMMDDLAALSPDQIIYVSCHPAALARDAGRLVRLGYRPQQWAALDMFPQTGHLEVMLVLQKS